MVEKRDMLAGWLIQKTSDGVLSFSYRHIRIITVWKFVEYVFPPLFLHAIPVFQPSEAVLFAPYSGQRISLPASSCPCVKQPSVSGKYCVEPWLHKSPHRSPRQLLPPHPPVAGRERYFSEGFFPYFLFIFGNNRIIPKIRFNFVTRGAPSIVEHLWTAASAVAVSDIKIDNWETNPLIPIHAYSFRLKLTWKFRIHLSNQFSLLCARERQQRKSTLSRTVSRTPSTK